YAPKSGHHDAATATVATTCNPISSKSHGIAAAKTRNEALTMRERTLSKAKRLLSSASSHAATATAANLSHRPSAVSAPRQVHTNGVTTAITGSVHIEAVSRFLNERALMFLGRFF
ncbi:MAG: hypothetical protein KIG47_01780, partial [Prevotellamassilia sp.]|nr:hypothetical protein [Prevotellamassilia sp.]